MSQINRNKSIPTTRKEKTFNFFSFRKSKSNKKKNSHNNPENSIDSSAVDDNGTSKGHQPSDTVSDKIKMKDLMTPTQIHQSRSFSIRQKSSSKKLSSPKSINITISDQKESPSKKTYGFYSLPSRKMNCPVDDNVKCLIVSDAPVQTRTLCIDDDYIHNTTDTMTTASPTTTLSMNKANTIDHSITSPYLHNNTIDHNTPSLTIARIEHAVNNTSLSKSSLSASVSSSSSSSIDSVEKPGYAAALDNIAVKMGLIDSPASNAVSSHLLSTHPAQYDAEFNNAEINEDPIKYLIKTRSFCDRIIPEHSKHASNRHVTSSNSTIKHKRVKSQIHHRQKIPLDYQLNASLDNSTGVLLQSSNQIQLSKYNDDSRSPDINPSTEEIIESSVQQNLMASLQTDIVEDPATKQKQLQGSQNDVTNLLDNSVKSVSDELITSQNPQTKNSRYVNLSLSAFGYGPNYPAYRSVIYKKPVTNMSANRNVSKTVNTNSTDLDANIVIDK